MKKFKFIINGSDYEVSVNEIEQNVAEIEVNGTPFTVEIEKQEKVSTTPLRKEPGKVNPIATPSKALVSSSLKAPLPGSIIKVLVTEGQSVKRGDVVMIMESMKMENNILAENDSIVKKVHVQAGQSVMQDDLLIDFDGASSAPNTPTPSQVQSTPAAQAPKSAGLKTIKSPLPGSVIAVKVQTGQSVSKGDVLLTLESMKMENNILAEKDGVVRNIHVSPGQSVMQDDNLIDIE